MTAAFPKVTFTSGITRGVTPGITQGIAQGWLRQQVDPRTILEVARADWFRDVVDMEALFKKHVYESDNVTDSDLRQHRANLCALMSSGEFLSLAYAAFGEEKGIQEEVQATVALLDQKIKSLFETLIAWHGPLSAQSDIPESFKQASREVEEGKVVDMDI